MAWKTSCSPGKSARSETDTNRITIGLTLRRTARKIRRLKGVVGGMCPSYSDSADPRFPDALVRQGVAQRSPFCECESDGDGNPSSRSRSARGREDRPGCCRIVRESAARASGGFPNPDVDTVSFGLRIVFHYGPAYPMDTASALPSPRFEMLSLSGQSVYVLGSLHLAYDF